eukprot:752661-Hanusia_phi.AAC.1
MKAASGLQCNLLSSCRAWMLSFVLAATRKRSLPLSSVQPVDKIGQRQSQVNRGNFGTVLHSEQFLAPLAQPCQNPSTCSVSGSTPARRRTRRLLHMYNLACHHHHLLLNLVLLVPALWLIGWQGHPGGSSSSRMRHDDKEDDDDDDDED